MVTADRSCLHCAGCRWRQKPLCGGCLALRTKPCFEQCPWPAHLSPWQMCCTACLPTYLSHVSEAVSASCSGARVADPLDSFISSKLSAAFFLMACPSSHPSCSVAADIGKQRNLLHVLQTLGRVEQPRALSLVHH